MLPRPLAFAAALLLCSGFAFAKNKQAEGWATVKEMDEALAFAKKTGKPVAVLYAMRESTCPIHNGSVTQVMNDRGLADMVRVVLYDDEGRDKAWEYKQKVEASNVVPQVFLLDPEGRLTSFIDSADIGKKLKPEAAKLAQIATWVSTAQKQLERADKEAAAGRFKAALKAAEAVQEQDRLVTDSIAGALSGEAKGERPAAKSPAKSPAKSGKSAGETPSAKEAPKSKAAPEGTTDKPGNSEKPAGRYFPGVVQAKRDAYEKLAAERLEQAKAKLAENDTPGARKLIAAMVADGSDLPSVQAAAELVKEAKPAKPAKK